MYIITQFGILTLWEILPYSNDPWINFDQRIQHFHIRSMSNWCRSKGLCYLGCCHEFWLCGIVRHIFLNRDHVTSLKSMLHHWFFVRGISQWLLLASLCRWTMMRSFEDFIVDTLKSCWTGRWDASDLRCYLCVVTVIIIQQPMFW